MGLITQEIRVAMAAAQPEDIAARWRAFLRLHYPGAHRAKAVAADLNVSIKTAERWLANDGPAPSATNLMRAALAFGFAALEQVLLPAGAAVPAPRATVSDLAAKLDLLSAQINAIREVTCPPS